MGELGCVGWLFDARGVISVQTNGSDPDEVALMAIDAGAADVRVEDSTIEIFTEPSDLDRVRNALVAEKLDVSSAELAMVPKTTLEADPKDALAVLRLMERLEDLDDVQRVYTNLDFSDDVLEQIGGR
jgi:transcriptional/translational regulatory protein YebC/TACO1